MIVDKNERELRVKRDVECFYCGKMCEGVFVEWLGHKVRVQVQDHPQGSIALHPKCAQRLIAHLGHDAIRAEHAQYHEDR